MKNNIKMKKTIFAIASVAILAFASCSGNKTAETESAAVISDSNPEALASESIPADSIVGVEMAAPADSNGVIAGVVDEEKVR